MTATAHKHEHMKLTKAVLREEGSRRILTVEVPLDEVKKQRQLALTAIQQKAHLQGFRTGKAPPEIIEREFRKEIDQETVEHVVQEAYHTALEQHSLNPIAQAKIADLKFEPDQPLTFTATVEVRPVIDLPTYKGLSVKKPKVHVTDQDVKTVLEALQHQRAEYVKVEDRGGKEGDVITVDLKGMSELKVLPNISETNASFTIGSKSFEPLEQALVGSKPSDEKRVVVQIPSDHPDESIRGREVTFYATVKEVKEPKLPSLDEAFIKSVSTAENLEALQKQIHDQLTHERERASREAAKKDLLEQLVNAAKFDPPESMVQGEYDRMLQDLDQQLQKRGTTLEKIPVPEQLDIKQKYWKMAQGRVKGSLVLEEIAKKEQMIPVPEAIEQLAENISQSPQVDPTLKDHVKTARGRAQLQYDVTIERTFDFIIEQAKIIDEEEDKKGG